MDVQLKAGSLVRTIAERKILGIFGKIVTQLRAELTSMIAVFLSTEITAMGMFKLENRLAETVRESARKILQWFVSNLEPELKQMPGALKHNSGLT